MGYPYGVEVAITELIGKTLTKVEGAVGEDEIRFTLGDGSAYRLFHYQDCCESVNIEDICGDLSDLVGSPIISAEESTNEQGEQPWPEGVPKPEFEDASWTWTFYRIATAKGLVVIRWYGSSNGYYGESVDFEKIDPTTKE